MTKIVLIGAGSQFGARLSVDIMATPSLVDSEICLCDLHEGRLAKVTAYVQRMIDAYKLPTKLSYSTDRTKLLPGADYVITSVAVGGGAYYGSPYREEIEIPRKYGIEQEVADTYSVGATFRFLRTAPVHMQICQDIKKYCPNALLLNHTNPMAALTMIHDYMGVKNVGICHGVQGTADMLSRLLGFDSVDKIAYNVMGINHLAWFMDLKKADGGEDLYPRLRERLGETDDPDVAAFLERESVRCEIMKTFGYFPTESNRHDSEYLPYFRRTHEMIESYHLKPKPPVAMEMPFKRAWADDGAGDQKPGELKSSREYTISIINAIKTGEIFRFNGNVMNTEGVISNLPRELCVEVPCMADSFGVHPVAMGRLPAHLAGMNHACATPVILAVESIIERDPEKAFYAIATDMNAQSLLTIPQLRSMFNELWEAEGDLLEYYEKGYVTERYALN